MGNEPKKSKHIVPMEQQLPFENAHDEPKHKQLLDEVNHEIYEQYKSTPSKTTVQNILNYSKSLKVEKSKQVGDLAYNMN